MKIKHIIFMLCVVPLLAFTAVHKYYISVTQVNYIKKQEALQITSRVFVDDLETALRKKYSDTITLTGLNKPEKADSFIETYLRENIILNINTEKSKFIFIGKEYDGDIVRCYLEVPGIKNIKSLSITNTILFNVYSEQQNIVKTKINDQQKSKVLSNSNRKFVLNFN
ncbi:DUF6702 family protein [Neotamlana laminarinivorans]|uniref:Peptidase E n=1 Tax=Neotamlana laminarinivorans TaxID=2883124 RepID=A0A9X1I250_9FLAO|nr:DUF6702 family protein [Tamlana laminarinivorans]MCB4799640.1 peptidase E [Tamlana laminarinivorans]